MGTQLLWFTQMQGEIWSMSKWGLSKMESLQCLHLHNKGTMETDKNGRGGVSDLQGNLIKVMEAVVFALAEKEHVWPQKLRGLGVRAR